MSTDQIKTEQPPVEVSDEAMRALSKHMREWSGWPDSSVQFGEPTVSPVAQTDHNTHVFTANADLLVLNPHRIVRTVTPFRMRQEAVMTGALLHEAGHARFTRWKPRNDEEAANFTHDGAPVTQQELALATLLEEPRIEGAMAEHAHEFGAHGLVWTMRASAARLLEHPVKAQDPEKQIMDVLQSWILLAGRRWALYKSAGVDYPRWAGQFDRFLQTTLSDYFDSIGSAQHALGIEDLLKEGVTCRDHTGTTVVGYARKILNLLFPETEDESKPEPSAGCQSEQQGDSDEGDSDEGDSDEGESDEGESDEGESDEGESDEGDSDESNRRDKVAETLAQIQQAAQQAQQEESSEDSAAPQPDSGGVEEPGGEGDNALSGGTWRVPTKSERDLQRGAERFLRSVIDPTESSKVTVTDSPSSTVDAAALSAWRASGGRQDPRFFRRTHRNTEPAPPMKIAVLVDISGSMDDLQHPSSVLSWALSSAAFDLRNFAGRGQQIETTLIEWGTTTRVVQPNDGKAMPGIRTTRCMMGTTDLHMAMDEVENQIPGFFDTPEQPVNRLLVQFTDWQLAPGCARIVDRKVKDALAAGVNMLSVVPSDYNERRSSLPTMLSGIRGQRGRTSALRYNRNAPERVWDQAERMLSL